MYRVLLLSVSLGFWALHVAVSEIPLGSRLLVGEDSLWASPNGDFALGFLNSSDLTNRFSIGIRFYSKTIPPDQRNVVWVAGADVTVSDNSYFELTHEGELVLFDSSRGVPVWNSNTSGNSVSSALVRDDGNLVLINEENEIAWQSFDTPSDTLLPGQKLSAFEMLRAASENSRSSYYSLHMEDSGRLELRWESNITFWSSGNEAAKGQNISAVVASEGALLLAGEDTRPVWSAFGEDHNDTVKFRFLRLDKDGNLRMYSWNSDLNKWKSVWQAIENQCRVFATCGQQICSFNMSGYPECKCVFTLAPMSDPKCLAPYQQMGCKSGIDMVEFKHLYLYGIYPANNDSVYLQISLDKCKKMCLDEASCTAVTYSNDGTARCFLKLTRYISGYSDPSLTSLSYVKRCSDPFAVDPRDSKVSSNTVKSSSYMVCLPCLVGATCSTLVLFIGVQLGIGLYIWRRRKQVGKKSVQLFRGTNPKGLIILSVDEIKAITENFKHSIGPMLFKGVLPENQPVAVKQMEAAAGMEERKFRSFASKIASIHHKNLAKLEGYCCELGQRFLVYEYAKNTCLLHTIQDSSRGKKLTWKKRIDICVSIAKALGYLHNECREFICHGNLNCKNIVLDENLEAKLIEFGFRSCSADIDVKDFGNTILTVITGRCDPEEMYREWIEGRKESIVDKRLEGGFDPNELERVLRISFWCVQGDERLRPSMAEVVKVLEGTLSVDPPPPPFVCPISSPANSSVSE